MTARGVLVGPIIQPMSIARITYGAGPLWRDAENLVQAVATSLAECDGYSGSYNDNLDANDAVVSRDCGLFQINIPVVQIGSAYETRLREDPVFNAGKAYDLFAARGWQPWAAYNSGVAFDDTYQARALLGTVNFLGQHQLELAKEKAPDRGAHHTLRVPFISRKQLRVLYPDIPLG